MSDFDVDGYIDEMQLEQDYMDEINGADLLDTMRDDPGLDGSTVAIAQAEASS